MNKLLIIEDDSHQRELYAMELRDEKYSVDQASDGKEALNMIKKNKYDLVITDIRMPGIDGIEVLGKLIAKNRNIPVIIYTAYSNYKSNFMTWAADAYVTKSSDLMELKNKIRELLAVKTG